MRKLDKQLENPVDNKIYQFVEHLAPIVKKNNLSPNMITSIGNIFTLISFYFIIKKQPILAIIFVLLGYISDCLDGYVARKYNMVTKFGDYYDHISDLLKHTIIFVLLYFTNTTLFMKFVPLILLVILLFGIHLYYQEILYGKFNESPSMYNIQLLFKNFLGNTKEIAKERLKYTRYIGGGTSELLLCLLIFLVVGKKK